VGSFSIFSFGALCCNHSWSTSRFRNRHRTETSQVIALPSLPTRAWFRQFCDRAVVSCTRRLHGFRAALVRRAVLLVYQSQSGNKVPSWWSHILKWDDFCRCRKVFQNTRTKWASYIQTRRRVSGSQPGTIYFGSNLIAFSIAVLEGKRRGAGRELPTGLSLDAAPNEDRRYLRG
jgi:hypothetical protein